MTANPSSKAIRITVSLTPLKHAELSAIADKAKVSLSWITRQALDEFLERHDIVSEKQLPLQLSQAKR